MIYILFGLITALMLISIIVFHKDLTAPAFLLNAAFWVASFCACLYADKWEFSNLTLITVVMSGLCGFFLFSLMTYLFDKTGRRTIVRELVPLEVSSGKLLVYLMFQVLLFGLSLVIMFRNIGGQLGNIATLVGTYYELNRAGDIIYSSLIVNVGQIVNFSGTYYVLYVAINNLICNKKNNPLLYINILIGILGSLLNGTKTSFYMFIISIFVMTIVLISKRNGWKKNINLKTMVKVCILLTMLLSSFSIINSIQGRTLSDVKAVDTLATYLGSPLKNLEIFISEEHVSNEIFGAQTFKSIYSDLYEMTGDSSYDITSLYNYRWINGNGLGNVYTIFMPLYYDFGIIGTFLVMGLMGLFTQRIYDKLKFRKKILDVDYYLIFYAYLAFSIMFSFFSNKFFESICSKAGIYFLVGMWFFDVFFMRLNIKNMKISLKKTRHNVEKV